MSTREHEFDPILLELHLGRLSNADQAAALERVARDADLARDHEALTAVFAALNTVREERVSEGLAARIAATVAEHARPPRAGASRARVLAEAEARTERGVIIRMSGLRDVIAVAAVLVLAIGLGVPGLLQVRERSQRTVCASNLARLGQGLQTYAAAFNDNLPFAGWSSHDSWRPAPGVAVQPNRRHMYRLLAQGDVQPTWFVCPASTAVAMPLDQVRTHDDFLDANNVSLVFQNMAGARPSLRSAPDLPVFADDNPLFDNGRPLDLLNFSDPAKANSRAHNGAGQNVLTLSGHVRWETTPNCGINGDNIWTLNGVDAYTGREGPRTESDSHLLK